ncbi:uncharacterized protein LOC116023388 [Ipomoea triloba]|uniref:uncharacterized protein LOC116023388 n=1 Tax=Ipomoea triloba TaxID=35885 RepID=UPI00125CF96C|nr:uncharacterized protein LOC116023388 [Ipomoea triloba]
MYQPPLPFPGRVRKSIDKTQYGKFLELLKQLHINVPFLDALGQMSRYAKFLKDLLTNKRKLEESTTVLLGEGCSAYMCHQPQKLTDPGSFTIPCQIGEAEFKRALADSGASINIMPFCLFKKGASINIMPFCLFKKLDLGNLKPTRICIQLADRSIKPTRICIQLADRSIKQPSICIQLADRSIKQPKGVVEDVLVRVDKFIFPVEFVIIDMDADQEVLLILGRPFLATAWALIDVGNGKLVLSVGDKCATFDVSKLTKYPMTTDDACYFVDVFHEHVNSIYPNLVGKLKDNALLRVLDSNDDLESFTFDNNASINENDDALHEIVCVEEVMDGNEGDELLHNEKINEKKNIVDEKEVKSELKTLPDSLQYAFLGENSTLTVVISSKLDENQQDKLVNLLGKYKGAIGWKLQDLKGISPSMCTHKIL